MEEFLKSNQIDFKTLESNKIHSASQFQNKLKQTVFFINYIPDEPSIGKSIKSFDFDINAFESDILKNASDCLLDFENALLVF